MLKETQNTSPLSSKNTTVVIINLPNGIKIKFNDKCKSKGTTMSDELRRYIYKFIK